mmetsp:Transcript_7596/g.30790  ORF Transcript_7596/g.30790 Transcript_7596/m.30790 type:complete len:255 (+) Transcript_7596:212-976(+)
MNDRHTRKPRHGDVIAADARRRLRSVAADGIAHAILVGVPQRVRLRVLLEDGQHVLDERLGRDVPATAGDDAEDSARVDFRAAAVCFHLRIETRSNRLRILAQSPAPALLAPVAVATVRAAEISREGLLVHLETSRAATDGIFGCGTRGARILQTGEILRSRFQPSRGGIPHHPLVHREHVARRGEVTRHQHEQSRPRRAPLHGANLVQHRVGSDGSLVVDSQPRVGAESAPAKVQDSRRAVPGSIPGTLARNP